MRKTGLSGIRSYFFPTAADLESGKAVPNYTQPAKGGNMATQQDKSPEAIRRNLSNYLTPVQLARLKQDLSMWRAAMNEAELAYSPHRVRQQQMYIDTILNGHVASVMEKRQDLTLLRGFKFVKGEKDESKDLKAQFEEYTWFPDFIQYCLDAIFFGYSLISLGNVVNGDFDDVDIVRRWNVSPDREIVSTLIYSLSGKSWNDDDTKPWHIYVKTKSENGVSKCGYGLFYKIGLYEIFLRNTLGYNGDFVELYSQPYRVGKTTKTTEEERNQLEAAVRNMGSAGYAIIDPFDEIQFLESKLGGTGWQGYDNLEQRCQKIISKLVLGHADAMDSIPGKLGSSGGDDNPIAQALADKQTKDGRFIMPIVNRLLIPRMQEMGLIKGNITGYKWVLENDDEAEEMRAREDKSNLITSQIAQTMATANMQMDANYFEERTGIPTSAIAKPDPAAGGADEFDDEEPKPPTPAAKKDKIKNMMGSLYGRK